MTSIEWLIMQLPVSIRVEFYEKNIYLQAKKMHKQEVIDAAERWKGTDFAERYYQDTYGSNGSGVLTEGSGAVGNIGGAVELPKKDHVAEVKEVVEDDVEKLANIIFETGSCNILHPQYQMRKMFIKGYILAKEILYTEEQVREAYWIGVNRGNGVNVISIDNFLQSLKQINYETVNTEAN